MYVHTIKVPTVTLEQDDESGEWSEKVEHVSKTFVLKSFSLLPGSVSKNHPGDAEGQMWAAFAWGLPPDQYVDLGTVPMSELDNMLKAWQRDSNLLLGE